MTEAPDPLPDRPDGQLGGVPRPRPRRSTSRRRSNSRRGGSRLVSCGLLVVALVASAGCLQTTVIRDGWADFAADSAAGGATVTRGGPPEGRDRLAGRRVGDRPHRIHLASFEGPEQVADAHEATVLARRVAGLGNVLPVSAQGVTLLYAGRFADARDPAARRALKEVRRLRGSAGTVFDGDRPFKDAELVTLAGLPVGASPGAPTDPLDLRTHPGLFSLQVGFFDAAAKPDRFTAAERWANQLRREDRVEAFFYHGPNRSLVTVGLFAQSDFVQEGQLEAYPPAARALQKRFPHNLGNGSQLLEKRRGQAQGTPQGSLLVRAPG